MLPRIAPEIQEMILEEYVADSSLDDDFDTRISPFNESLPPYPSARRELAKVCTMVSKTLYDLATPIVWQYLIIRSEKDIRLLLKLIKKGMLRETRMPIGHYAQRIDFRAWRKVSIDLSIELMHELPNVRVLTLECQDNPAPLWRHPSNKPFLYKLPELCPHLRRLQFLDPREAPTLRELARLSRKCLELRALQVVHVADTYRTYDSSPSNNVSEEEEDQNEHDGEEQDEDGDFQEIDSDVEWESHDVIEDESDDWYEVEGMESYISNTDTTDSQTTPALPLIVGDDFSSEDEEEEPKEERLKFDFLKLKYLILGMGHIHGLISERRSIARLVEAMAPFRRKMQLLERIDLNVPMEGVRRPLLQFNEVVDSGVLHMYYRSYPRTYALFANIRRIVVVIHTAYISLPLDLNRLETFEILLRRPIFEQHTGLNEKVARRMLRTARILLDVLLQDKYPMLESILIWRTATVHLAGINSLIAKYKDDFEGMGIILSGRNRPPTYACDPAGALELLLQDKALDNLEEEHTDSSDSTEED